MELESRNRMVGSQTGDGLVLVEVGLGGNALSAECWWQGPGMLGPVY